VRAYVLDCMCMRVSVTIQICRRCRYVFV